MDVQRYVRGIIRISGLLGFLAPLGLVGLVSTTAQAQTTQTCNTSGTIASQVASTGLAEQIGDLVITCSGGVSGLSVIGALYITLNTNITNSLDANGNPQNITLSGNGATVTAASAVLTSSSTLLVNTVNYTVPAPSTSPVTLRISGIRAAVASIQNGLSPASVSATLAAPGFSLLDNQVVVAIGTGVAVSSALNNGIPCAGSPVPSSLDFPSFVAAGAASSAVRVTETVANAFAAKALATTNGTRILINFSGYGTGVRLFVPDAIVGNSGTIPTTDGEFASGVSGGTYTPLSNQLLLSRVSGSEQNGNGGSLVAVLPSVITSFTSVSELAVTSGAAYAVYEVLNANPSAVESFQVPVFIGTVAGNCSASLTAELSAELGPISTVSVATATDPVPRYVAAALGSDCQQIGDCTAGYFPILTISSAPVSFAGSSFGVVQQMAIALTNTGGTQLNLIVSITYQTGLNWLSAIPVSGAAGLALNLTANPAALQPGVYTATVTLNAGVAGSATIPVTFTVGPAGVTVQAIVNAASFQPGVVSPGGYVALFGSDLTGTTGTATNPSVTFNGLNATVVYASASQINLIVPASLSGQNTAAVVVNANGQISNTFTAALAPNAPGIFNPGVLNSDNTVNSPSRPAIRGTSIQVYLTGLASPVIVGTVTVTIGGQSGISPSFAGAQPTYPALDQINVTVPASLSFTGNSAPLSVCVVPVPLAPPICSATVPLYLQ
jgi:uncharacterized protein (TIGR03437 family)